MTPRRRRQTPDTDTVELANINPPPASNAAPLSVTEERREAELESILDEIGSESRVKVWQVTDGKSSYAGEISGSEFSLDMLLDTYGGGDKTLAIYIGKERISTVKVALDPSIPSKNPRQPKAAAAAAPGAPDAMTGLMTAMAASTLQNSQAMSQLMIGMVTAMTGMMTATRGKDPTETAIELAKVMRPTEHAGMSPSDILSMLKHGMDIGERLGGGGGDDDGVMTAVNKGLDVLGGIVNQIVESNKNKQLAAAPTIAPVPVSVVGPGGDTAAPPPLENTNPGPPAPEGAAVGTIRPWVAAARPYIGQLMTTSKFMPPDAAAATINANMNDDQFSDLIDDIADQSAPGFVTRLASYFPHVDFNAVDPQWFGRVVEILITDYVEDDDAPGTPDPSPEPDKAS